MIGDHRLNEINQQDSAGPVCEVILDVDAGCQQCLPSPLLSVIVPAYNEPQTVGPTLDAVLAEETSKEVIIVDDGSDNETAQSIGAWAEANVELNTRTGRMLWLRLSRNTGKGAAIRHGLQFASGKYVVVQDADLEVQPSAYATLLGPLMNNHADLVIGRRRGLFFGSRILHAGGVWLLNQLVRFLYRYRVHDASCCFKVLSLKNMRAMRLESDGFEFCPEVIAKASGMGLRLAEVDVTYTPRSHGHGKKLKLVRDGIIAVKTLWHFRHWELPNSDESCEPQNDVMGSPGMPRDASEKPGASR